VKVNQIFSINYGLVYSNDFVSMFEANERNLSLSLSLSRDLSRKKVTHRHLVSISMRSDLTCH
jgi:hypothetical protein